MKITVQAGQVTIEMLSKIVTLLSKIEKENPDVEVHAEAKIG